MATGHTTGTDGVLISMCRSQMSRHYPVSTESSTVFSLCVVMSEYISVYRKCVHVCVEERKMLDSSESIVGAGPILCVCPVAWQTGLSAPGSPLIRAIGIS